VFFKEKSIALQCNAFSSQPFSFTEPKVHKDLAAMLEIYLLENGDRLAREHWQKNQLYNLMNFAFLNSNFWKKRIPKILSKQNMLDALPILKREELAFQVKSEGSLAKKIIGIDTKSYPSSGSTGTPVEVHVCPQNASYNEIYSLAQYFIEGRSLNKNRTFICPAVGDLLLQRAQGIKVEIFDTWIGELHRTFKTGSYKIIHFFGDEEALIQELSKEPLGYLACPSSYIDILIRKGGKTLIDKLGIHMWLHFSDNRGVPEAELFHDLGIPVRSSYSCAETGPIAIECTQRSGYYHVSHSNVIVEVDPTIGVEVNGVTLGRVLLTHLHSYATPLLRYDVGDFACLHPGCPCGHAGATLSHIYGRSKYFLSKVDGSLLPFPIFSKPLLDLTSCTDFFVYQPTISEIVIEIGGRDYIPPQEEKNIQNFINLLSDPSFKVIVKAVPQIDWSKNPKRLPFINKVKSVGLCTPT